MMGFSPFAWLCLAIGTPCALVALFIYHIMIDEVNRKLPPEEQFAHFYGARGRWPFDISQRHRNLYPNSKLTLLMTILMGVVFLCFLAAAAEMVLDRPPGRKPLPTGRSSAAGTQDVEVFELGYIAVATLLCFWMALGARSIGRFIERVSGPLSKEYLLTIRLTGILGVVGLAFYWVALFLGLPVIWWFLGR